MIMEKDEQRTNTNIRPTKKQKELLVFIEDFISERGYSPSYREIMAGTGHNSVATVSLHINSLINRGHLAKRGRSARSLELVGQPPKTVSEIPVKQLKASEEKWLVNKVELFFKAAESAAGPDEAELDRLHILVGALKVLGLEGAAGSFSTRLSALKKRRADNQYSV